VSTPVRRSAIGLHGNNAFKQHGRVMIDESRPRMRSRTGPKRSLRRSQAFLALVSAVGLVLGGLVLAAPGQAEETLESSEESSNGVGNVCPPLDSGKIDTPDGPLSVTVPNDDVELPEGALIDEYCVKAGSPNQEEGGPILVPVDPPASSVTFSYPGGKEISHYSVSFVMQSNGSLKILKDLSNPDGADVPEVFAIGYECKIDDDVTKSGSEDVTPGMTGVSVSGIPVGSTCRIDEMTPNPIEGYTWSPVSYDPQSVEIASADGSYTVKAKNEITKVNGDGSLKIVKDLSNPNDATVPESFPIDYECILDEEIVKSGSVDVAPGMMGETVSGIPTGATCTIEEQELPTIPGFTWATPSYEPRSGEVEIESEGQTYTVKVINEIFKDNPGRGQLELVKTLTGGPEGYVGPFTLEYLCTKEGHDDVSGSRTVDAGSSAMISDLRPGTECVVSEPSLPTPPSGFSFGVPTFDPSDTVQIKSKDKVTVTTQNTLTRDEGNLRVTKSLTGTPADFDPDFDVSYTCTLEGEEDITGSATVAAGGSVELPSEGTIPAGYECTVIEGALPTLPAGYSWNAPGYSNNQGTEPGNVVTIVKNTVLPPDQEIPIDQMATVAIANSATTPSVPVTPASGGGAGALTVSKTLTGGPEGFAPAFSIAWACSGSTGSLSGVLSVAAGGSATVFNVPNGYTCSVSEDALPDAPAGFTWGIPAISGSPTSAISGNSTVSVTVANSLIAEEVAPVEPASPVEPAVPVEPASPDTPAGVPLLVPAGGGAALASLMICRLWDTCWFSWVWDQRSRELRISFAVARERGVGARIGSSVRAPRRSTRLERQDWRRVGIRNEHSRALVSRVHVLWLWSS
jgi:hypothetical protein